MDQLLTLQHIYIDQSIYLSIYQILSIYLSISLSICLTVCLPSYLPASLSSSHTTEIICEKLYIWGQCRWGWRGLVSVLTPSELPDHYIYNSLGIFLCNGWGLVPKRLCNDGKKLFPRIICNVMDDPFITHTAWLSKRNLLTRNDYMRTRKRTKHVLLRTVICM